MINTAGGDDGISHRQKRLCYQEPYLGFQDGFQTIGSLGVVANCHNLVLFFKNAAFYSVECHYVSTTT